VTSVATRRKRLTLAGIELAVTVDDRRMSRLRRLSSSRLLIPVRRVFGIQPGVSAAEQELPLRGERLDVASFSTPEARDVAARANEVEWYHVIKLPHGVVTPGYVDHRDLRDRYGLPADMRGMRVLEVATFDGFWAFEMERRGAEVVATDIASWFEADIPLRMLEKMTPADDERTGAGFRVAKELLGSVVRRHEVSVYNLDPGELGTFDMVFVSDLMLHLRDPQRALERMYEMLKPGGYLLIAEPYNPDLEGYGDMALTQYFGFLQYIWSIPSIATLLGMLRVAGFDPIEEVDRLPLVYHHPFPVRKIVLKARHC
jgi:tRNA (mo5U34)-methyltransferase